ncbi:MAG: mechanosensitive ion channel domain-containing protein [Phycisphaerales bacterium]
MIDAKALKGKVVSSIRVVVFAAGVLLCIGGFALPAWGQEKEAAPVAAEPNASAQAAAPAAATADPNAAARSALMETGTPAPVIEITFEMVQARRKQAAESTDLSDEVKARLAEIYDRAIAQFRLATELKAKRKQFNDAVKGAPEKLASIRATLEQPAPESSIQVPADLTLPQAEQSLTQATAALDEAKRTADNLEAEPKRRAERKTRIPEETNAARQRLEEIKTRLGEAEQMQVAAMSQGVQTLLQLERAALQAQLDANADEVLSYDATNDLLAAQRDLAARQLTAAQKRAEFWQQKVSELRQRAAEDAQAKAIAAAKQTKYAHPVIQKATEYNAQLAKEQAEVTASIDDRSQYAATISEQLAAIQKDFKETQEQVVRAGGVTDVMGVRLLAKRGKLPSVAESRRRIRSRATKTNDAQVKWIEYDTAWSELTHVEQQADRLLDEIRPPLGEEERPILRGELIEVLQARRKTLKTLSDLYLDYSTRLAALDTQEREFVRLVGEFGNFIDANILWVKSRDKPRTSDVAEFFNALYWLVSPTNWYRTVVVLGQDLRQRPLPYLLVFVLVVTAIVSHSSIHRRIAEISEQMRHIRTDDFLLTVRVLVMTILLAATWPAVVLLIAWLLSSAAPDDEFAHAIRSGLLKLAYVMLALGFLIHLFMPHGLAEAHFRIRREPLVFLRRHLRWFFLAAVPVVFVMETMQAQQINQEWHVTVGRLFFVAAHLGAAAFLFIVLRPKSPLLEGYLRQRRDGWVDRLRYIWFPAAFLMPVGLAGVAVTGYLYGARYLTDRLLDTAVLVVVIMLVRAMFIRWLMIAQRKLALLERQKRQEATLEQALQEEKTPTSARPSESVETKAKAEATISQISQQTRQLIDAVTVALLLLGTWYIWDDVLPALAMIGRHPLWTLSDQEQITLGALGTALLVAILTAIVARNAPGLLEIVILRRLPIDRAVRFAIITVSRYLLVIIGLAIAFTEIGIGWSKIQWLIAAMTVGLGFGLQEIFANFISGLIILFEQPIRVDDVVTVGDVTGRVTKIKIRATTIRMWDERELIMPNKEFITGTLINWTLSDTVVRRDFPVGIAYGSDIRKAERLLYEIAASNRLVLKDPPPVVIFKGFGASSLDFELRVFLSGMENNIPVWHGVNCAIDDAFRKAGIEIAFPQQDVHIRSIQGELPIKS